MITRLPIHLIDTQFSEAHKSIIRSKDSTVDEIRRSITVLGEELGKSIAQEYFIKPEQISTPMGFTIDVPFFNFSKTAIITTKDDFDLIGTGIKRILDNSIVGFMDFQGQRGGTST